MDIQTKDGIILRGIPDGTPDEAIKARIKAIRAEQFVRSKPGPAVDPVPQFEREAQETLSVTPAELIAANPVVRTLTSAAKPVLSVASKIEGLWGGTGNRDRTRTLEGMQERGNAALRFGPAGTAADIAGAFLSPVGLGALKLPQAASAMGRIGQGAAIGGIAGATSDPDATLGHAATGMAMGAAIPGAVELGGALARGGRNLVDPWLPGGAKRVAGRNAVLAAQKGDKLDQVIKALRTAEPDVPNAPLTAGEAAVPAQSTEFSALQEVVRPKQSTIYNDLVTAQNDARVAAVRSVGQDKYALDTAKALRGANAEQNYGPIMQNRISPTPPEEMLARSLAGKEASKASALQDQGRFATQATQQENLAHGGTIALRGDMPATQRHPFIPGQTPFAPFNVGVGGGQARSPSAYPVEGMPRVPGRYTENIQRVPENSAASTDLGAIIAQREAERKFIDYQLKSLLQDAGRESPNMRALLERPSVRAAFEDAAKSAKEIGSYFPGKPGEPFSIANLQRMKESMDSGIRSAKASEAAGNRPELSPGELTKTKQAFTAWLEKRSPAWAKARDEFKRDSLPMNQMEIGQYLETKLVEALSDFGKEGKQRAGMYAQAMRDAAGTVKKSTGEQRYQDIAEALSYPQMQAVEGVGRSLGRTAEHERLARLGMDSARDIAGQVTPMIKSPGILSHAVTIPRAIINRLEGRVQGKSAEELATLMRNPNALADEMERTLRQREAIARVLGMPRRYGTRGAIIGGTSMTEEGRR